MKFLNVTGMIESLQVKNEVFMTFEIAVPILFILFFFLYFTLKDQRVVVFAAGFRLLLMALIIHLALRGLQWPFILLYVTLGMILILAVKTLWMNPKFDTMSKARKPIWFMAFILSVITLVLTIVFPA